MNNFFTGLAATYLINSADILDRCYKDALYSGHLLAAEEICKLAYSNRMEAFKLLITHQYLTNR